MIADNTLLPVIFGGLLAFSLFIYVLLDGFDLGIGILFIHTDDKEKNILMSSIAPFWDANETWLVMGTVLILVAFPQAQGIIMTELYIPITIMLFGLALRGSSFDFRMKDRAHRKKMWDNMFFLGSLITTLSQGFMLGLYMNNFTIFVESCMFSIGLGILLIYVYRLLGACWLIAKTIGPLQASAYYWAKDSIICLTLGFIWILLYTPQYSYLHPFALMYGYKSFISTILFSGLIINYLLFLRCLFTHNEHIAWTPYLYTVSLYTFGFLNLCLELYPYIIPGRMTLWEGAADADSLQMILYGFIVVMPLIICYNCILFYIFHGKAHHQKGYSEDI